MTRTNINANIRTKTISRGLNMGLTAGAGIGASMGGLIGILCLTGTADAACLRNQTDRTLYMALISSAGKREGNVRVGEEVCQAVPSGTMIKVTIVPTGGARIGCRVDLMDDEVVALEHFQTIDNCRFSKLQ